MLQGFAAVNKRLSSGGVLTGRLNYPMRLKGTAPRNLTIIEKALNTDSSNHNKTCNDLNR